jgi:hypothetical protein
MKMKVNSKEYLIEKTDLVVKVEESEDLIPYGYSIEYNYYGNRWSVYWTNIIYNSLNSALNAIIQIAPTQGDKYRVVPLYRMQGSHLRDYKISEVLGQTKSRQERLSEIKAWKLREDFELNGRTHKKGSVFIRLENGTIIKSGQTEKTSRILGIFSDNLIFEEIELKDEKWIYPHLLKELKNKIKNN